jgi:dihydrofolate reductase
VSKLRVHNFAVSIDGYGAGPLQSIEHPLGVGGEGLHTWLFQTKQGRAMIGESGGDEGIDNDFFVAGVEGIGATVMGRNMFGPVRGPWDEPWRGWWGDDPPFHHPVFVLTHHAHDPIEMQGGTTFYFVTEGIDAALARAGDAARSKDVRLGGGVSTIKQYLRAGLVDELHVPIVPTVLGSGESLFEGIDLAAAGYQVVDHATSAAVLHVRIAR